MIVFTEKPENYVELVTGLRLAGQCCLHCALFRLWLDTGLRRAEMVGLKVRDVTIKEGISTLIVRQGKGNRLREIGLERELLCRVRKSGRGPQAVYRVVNPEQHLSGKALWKQVRWYCRKAKIWSKISPHAFRVAMVTDALDGNAPLQHVQAVGGWTSTQMITEVYDRNRYAEPVARYRTTVLPRRRRKWL